MADGQRTAIADSRGRADCLGRNRHSPMLEVIRRLAVLAVQRFCTRVHCRSFQWRDPSALILPDRGRSSPAGKEAGASSAANSLGREISSEFLSLRPISEKNVFKNPTILGASGNIPCAAEHGIHSALQGVQIPCSAECRDNSRPDARPVRGFVCGRCCDSLSASGRPCYSVKKSRRSSRGEDLPRPGLRRRLLDRRRARRRLAAARRCVRTAAGGPAGDAST